MKFFYTTWHFSTAKTFINFKGINFEELEQIRLKKKDKKGRDLKIKLF